MRTLRFTESLPSAICWSSGARVGAPHPSCLELPALGSQLWASGGFWAGLWQSSRKVERRGSIRDLDSDPRSAPPFLCGLDLFSTSLCFVFILSIKSVIVRETWDTVQDSTGSKHSKNTREAVGWRVSLLNSCPPATQKVTLFENWVFALQIVKVWNLWLQRMDGNNETIKAPFLQMRNHRLRFRWALNPTMRILKEFSRKRRKWGEGSGIQGGGWTCSGYTASVYGIITMKPSLTMMYMN